MKESKLQSILASDLSVIESGLELIETEFYLQAPEYGTKGYIDILAKDKNGNYLVIEIKSRKSTTREAIHELFKYEEYLKYHYSINSDEIRLLIVATDWQELLIPFSSMYAQTSSNLEGYRCIVSSDEKSIVSMKKITPVSLVEDRLFNETQLQLWCNDEKDAEKCLNIIQKHYQSIGYDKYFVLVACAPEKFAEKEKAVMEEVFSSLSSSISGLERYQSPKYLITIITLKEDRSIVEKRVKSNSKLMEEIYKEGYQNISEMTDYYLANKAYYHDFWSSCSIYSTVELGSPTHLSHRIETEGWKIQELIRGHHFLKKNFITDQVIFDEAMDNKGAEDGTVSLDFSSDNRASIKKVYKAIEQRMEGKKFWRYPLYEELDTLAKAGKDYKGFFKYYDPMSVLRYLYLAVIDQDPKSFIPKSSLGYYEYDEENLELKTVALYGLYVKTKKSASFNDIIERYYDGSVTSLRTSTIFDGYRADNIQIAHDLGFELCVIRQTRVNPFALRKPDGKFALDPRRNYPDRYEMYNWNKDKYEKINIEDDVYELSYPAFYKQEQEFTKELCKALHGTEQAFFNPKIE